MNELEDKELSLHVVLVQPFIRFAGPGTKLSYQWYRECSVSSRTRMNILGIDNRAPVWLQDHMKCNLHYYPPSDEDPGNVGVG